MQKLILGILLAGMLGGPAGAAETAIFEYYTFPTNKVENHEFNGVLIKSQNFAGKLSWSVKMDVKSGMVYNQEWFFKPDEFGKINLLGTELLKTPPQATQSQADLFEQVVKVSDNLFLRYRYKPTNKVERFFIFTEVDGKLVHTVEMMRSEFEGFLKFIQNSQTVINEKGAL